jgi:hypothetical protein
MSHTYPLVAAVAAALLLPTLAHADTYTFTGGGSSTNWSDPANWLNGLVPPNNPSSHIIIAPTANFAIFTPPSAAAIGTSPLDIEVPAGQAVDLNLPATADDTTPFSNTITVNSSSNLLGNLAIYGPEPYSNYTLTFPSLTARGAFELATYQNTLVTFASVSLNGPLSIFDNFSLSNVSGPGSITQIVGTLTLNTANSFTGGATIQANGAFLASATGALSSGPISNDGTLFLNATAAANSDIAPSANSATGTVYYNANAAANGHHITANTINFASTITSLGGDTFTLTANGLLYGNASVFPLLIRGGNIDLPAGSSIFSDGSLPTVQNLGTNADLFLGINTHQPVSITVGAGTPWAGAAGVTVGTITANSNFSLLNINLQADILAASSPVHVTFLGANNLLAQSHNYSGVSAFTVASGATLELDTVKALGGLNGTNPAPLDVASGGTLVLADDANLAIDAPLTLHTGSTLNFDYEFSGGLSGAAAISRDNGPITFILNSPDAFAGPQLTPAFTQPGDIIYINADNIQNLQSLNPAATYVAQIGTSQSNDLVLNAGILQFSMPPLSQPGSLSGTGTLRIGDAGEIFLAGGDYTKLAFNKLVAPISNPIIATGPLTVGTTDPNATLGHGPVFLSGNNSFANITVQYAALGANSPASLTNASLTLDHAFLFLNTAPISPDTTATYNNTITVIGESTLDDHPGLFGDITYTQPVPRLTVATINLAAPLHLYVGSSTFHITNLHVTADTSLISHTHNRTIILDTLSQDTAHTLTLQGAAGINGAVFHASALSAFNGTIVIDNATLTLAAPENPASSPIFSLNAGAILDLATNYSFSRPTDPTLTGTGLLIIDPGTTLALPIDSPFAGTVEVNGTLHITPPRDPNSTLTTPTVTVLTTPVPEPTSLTLLLLAAPALLTRRRRRSQ